jgi:hypothetical protein
LYGKARVGLEDVHDEGLEFSLMDERESQGLKWHDQPRSFFQRVPCAREKRQMEIVRRVFDKGADVVTDSEVLIRFAALSGHLHLLTLVIDLSSIATPSPPIETQQDGESEELKKWMLNGRLLAEAVKRNNLRLIEHLCKQGAAKPECHGHVAFELAVEKRNVPALHVMLQYGGKGPSGNFGSDLLCQHLKVALGRRMLGFPIRKGGRSESVLEALIIGLHASREEFIAMGDEFIASSLIELGSIRLLEAATQKGKYSHLKSHVGIL